MHARTNNASAFPASEANTDSMRRAACSVSPLTAASAPGLVTIDAAADRALDAARKMKIPMNTATTATSQVVTPFSARGGGKQENGFEPAARGWGGGGSPTCWH